MTEMYVHNIPEPGSNVDVDVSQRAEPRPKPHATTDPMSTNGHCVHACLITWRTLAVVAACFCGVAFAFER